MKTIRKKASMILGVFLAATVCVTSGEAFPGRPEDGAIIENNTHKRSEVNPEAGDFLWELEGKPEPKYTSHTRRIGSGRRGTNIS